MAIDLTVGAQIDGYVLASDGSPVPDAPLRFLPVIGPGRSVDMHTDRAGYFAACIAPGHYKGQLFVEPGPGEVIPPPELVIAEAGGSYYQEFRLSGGDSSIAGVLLDQFGEPFGGITIVCYYTPSPEKGLGAHSYHDLAVKAVTAADGSFRLEGLLPARYAINLGGEVDYDASSVQSSRLGRPPTSVSIDLPTGGHLDVGAQEAWRNASCTVIGSLAVDEKSIISRHLDPRDVEVFVQRDGFPGEEQLSLNNRGDFTWEGQAWGTVRLVARVGVIQDEVELVLAPNAELHVSLSLP